MLGLGILDLLNYIFKIDPSTCTGEPDYPIGEDEISCGSVSRPHMRSVFLARNCFGDYFDNLLETVNSTAPERRIELIRQGDRVSVIGNFLNNLFANLLFVEYPNLINSKFFTLRRNWQVVINAKERIQGCRGSYELISLFDKLPKVISGELAIREIDPSKIIIPPGGEIIGQISDVRLRNLLNYSTEYVAKFKRGLQNPDTKNLYKVSQATMTVLVSIATADEIPLFTESQGEYHFRYDKDWNFIRYSNYV